MINSTSLNEVHYGKWRLLETAAEPEHNNRTNSKHQWVGTTYLCAGCKPLLGSVVFSVSLFHIYSNDVHLT
jgi:hypothetical protein